MTIEAVDLFCGSGGLTYGLLQAGIDVVAGVDADESCQWPFSHNTGARFVHSDLETLEPEEVGNLFESEGPKLLAGCAPCQPFSTYGRTRRSKDGRWRLLTAFQRMVTSLLPEFVTMENVPGLANHPVFSNFVRALEHSGYRVDHGVLEAERFGVPQRRKRLVLVASRVGDVEMPLPSDAPPRTVRDAIHHLPPISAGETHPDDRLHAAATLSELNLRRIRASRPGGTWRDWPIELRARCHRRDSGRTYPSVYGRMHWDEPAPTITTQCYGFGNGRFGHPEQDRAISLREAALLQSFPENWEFVPPHRKIEFAPIGRAIGNAVPPKLAEVIGRAIVTSWRRRKSRAIAA